MKTLPKTYKVIKTPPTITIRVKQKKLVDLFDTNKKYDNTSFFFNNSPEYALSSKENRSIGNSP